MTMDNIMKNVLVRDKNRNKKVLSELIFANLLCGVNLTDHSPAKDGMKFVTIFLLVFSAFGLFGQYYLVVAHVEDSFVAYIEATYTAFQTIIGMIKTTYCLFVHRKIYKFLQTAQEGEIVQKLEIFDMDLTISIKVQICEEITDILRRSWLHIRRQLLLYNCCIGLICSWYTFSGMIAIAYHQLAGTANYTTQTPFPSRFPRWWISDTFSFPPYVLQYIWVTCEAYIAGMSAISFDGIFIVLTMHGMALLRVLHAIIRYSTHAAVEPRLRAAYLRHCIHHFERTYQYYDDINNLYCAVGLAQIGLSLFILGMVLFQASVTLTSNISMCIKMVLFTTSANFQIFLFCYNGQMLTTESEKLNFSWYDCDWYQESKEFKELIKMMILRANRIMPMNVWGFTTMSFMTFLSIMQTSASYFLMLKNFSNYDQE